MNAFSRGYPEVQRYAMSEMRTGRMITVALTSLIVGICFYYVAASGQEDVGRALFRSAFWLQAAVLLLYGTSRTTGSVITERAEKTWDLQRLTPLSSWELAVGKLAGASILASYIAVLFLPWTTAGMLISNNLSFADFVWSYLLLSGAILFSWSLGLLVSAYGEGSVAGASAGTAGALVGVVSLSLLGPTLLGRTNASPEVMTFFGANCRVESVVLISSFCFGAWALAGARWRLGRELLEPRRCWRLPAFLVFLVVYGLGLGIPSPSALVAPCVMVYFAAVLDGSPADRWKAWRATPGGGLWWDRTPSWIGGAATCLLCAVGLAFVAPPAAGHLQNPALRLFPLLLCGFMLRDAAFIQHCRFSASRSPEIMALIFIGLAYALPSLVLGATRATDWFYLFVPAMPEKVSPWACLLPGWLQAATLVFFLRDRKISRD